jgi:hypothetical protein
VSDDENNRLRPIESNVKRENCKNEKIFFREKCTSDIFMDFIISNNKKYSNIKKYKKDNVPRISEAAPENALVNALISENVD